MMEQEGNRRESSGAGVGGGVCGGDRRPHGLDGGVHTVGAAVVPGVGVLPRGNADGWTEDALARVGRPGGEVVPKCAGVAGEVAKMMS